MKRFHTHPALGSHKRKGNQRIWASNKMKHHHHPNEKSSTGSFPPRAHVVRALAALGWRCDASASVAGPGHFWREKTVSWGERWWRCRVFLHQHLHLKERERESGMCIYIMYTYIYIYSSCVCKCVCTGLKSLTKERCFCFCTIIRNLQSNKSQA